GVDDDQAIRRREQERRDVLGTDVVQVADDLERFDGQLVGVIARRSNAGASAAARKDRNQDDGRSLSHAQTLAPYVLWLQSILRDESIDFFDAHCAASVASIASASTFAPAAVG